MIPFILIIQDGNWPFSMFDDLKRKHHWVLKILKYRDKDNLLRWIDKIIAKADAKYKEIQPIKGQAYEKTILGEEW